MTIAELNASDCGCGTRLLAEMPTIAEVPIEVQNRTWDMVVERGQELGIDTDPRPRTGVSD